MLSWAGVLALSLEPVLGVERVNRLRRLGRRKVVGERAHSALPAEAWPLEHGDAGAGATTGRAARRLASLTRVDVSGWTKAALAGRGIDIRDPLTDLRLLDFCLSVPVTQLHADGRPRALARLALADRLPPETLTARSRGYQGADWHEGLSADRATVTADLKRLAAIPAAARLLDLGRMAELAARWPSSGWTHEETLYDYRMALLRGLSVGRFLTRTLGANG
jgi:asparagine synthase (glutamine-hydrolysing)